MLFANDNQITNQARHVFRSEETGNIVSENK